MYRSPDRQQPEEFTESGSGTFAVGCAVLFLGAPVGSGVYSLYDAAGPVPAIVLAAVIVVALLAMYAFFNTERTVTIDERGIRLSHRRVALGYRSPAQVEWEIPLAELRRAREVKHHRPSKNGGWDVSVKLHLPQGRTIDAISLGGDQDDRTAYRRLVASLRQRLGSAFENVDDFGPMTEAMRKMAAEKQLRRD